MIRTGESYARAQVDEAWDVIVIGSGMGGLTTAALLSAYAGKRVLVLERHYVAGGFTHSFARPGYDWDVGVHYVGDMHREVTPTRRLMDLVTDGQVQWASMGDVYDRIVIDGDEYDYVAGLRNWRERMVEYFPDERPAIEAWIDRVKQATGSMRSFAAEKALPRAAARVAGTKLRSGFLTHASRTTAEVLDEITDNPRLRAVLTGQWGDYGLPPQRSSFGIHALVTNHYWGGAAYPVGGASTIAAGAERVINRGGGRILVKAEVDEVLVRGGRAVGVRMADGREFRADAVVSNAGVHTTWTSLVPPDEAARAGADELLTRVTPSVGHLSLYLGLDASTADLGLDKPNLWLYRQDDHDAAWSTFEADPESPLPVVYVSFPSAKDPDFEVRHPGHAAIDVIAPALREWFTPWEDTRWSRRGEDYEAVKDRFRQRMLDAMFEHVPAKVRDHLDVQELSTPLTTQHFANYGAGELYGIDHTTDRFAQKWLRPRTPIDGLWMTGQDVLTAGVSGALMAGVLTAGAMEGRDLLGHLLKSTVASRLRR